MKILTSRHDQGKNSFPYLSARWLATRQRPGSIPPISAWVVGDVILVSRYSTPWRSWHVKSAEKNPHFSYYPIFSLFCCDANSCWYSFFDVVDGKLIAVCCIVVCFLCHYCFCFWNFCFGKYWVCCCDDVFLFSLCCWCPGVVYSLAVIIGVVNL